MSKRGYFISLEGIEGAGKSSALAFIEKILKEAEIDYVVTREPGGTPIAEDIRKVLLHKHAEMMTPDTELLLFFAGRAQNIAHVIMPALQRGQWVIADRFTDASYAYQGGGRGLPMKHITALAEWVQGGLQPDLTFLFDVAVEIGLKRIKKRGIKDRIEREGLEFFERVRQAYLERATNYSDRFRVIRAEQDLAAVQRQLQDALSRIMEEVLQ